MKHEIRCAPGSGRVWSSGCGRLLPLLGAMALLAGCDALFPSDGTIDTAPSWQVEVRPLRMCPNERVRVAYRFPVFANDPPGARRTVIPECVPSLVPDGGGCSRYYPKLRLSPAPLFPMNPYGTTAYQGEIQSQAIASGDPVTLTVQVDPGSGMYASNGMRNWVGSLHPLRFTEVTQDASFVVDPINRGYTRSEQVVFPGQCQGSLAAWTPLQWEVGQARSAGVKLRRICNRERARSVRFTLVYNSGMPYSAGELAPGACANLPAESAVQWVRAIQALPRDPLAVGPMCQLGSDSAPPAPVRAELNYDCG